MHGHDRTRHRADEFGVTGVLVIGANGGLANLGNQRDTVWAGQPDVMIALGHPIPGAYPAECRGEPVAVKCRNQ